jgi:hypothetical protein
MPATSQPGFYGTDTETYYLAPSGRAWIVQSNDDLGTDEPIERSIPDDAIPVDDLLTIAERIEHLTRIESISDEELIED